MEPHELYDKILRELPKDGAWDDKKGYDETDLHYLRVSGYIGTLSEQGGFISHIGITGTGLKFISEGGFTEQFRQRKIRETDDALQRENWITTTKAARNARTTAIVSVIIAAMSLTVAAIALIRGL